jgi:HAMP domain-containing protein
MVALCIVALAGMAAWRWLGPAPDRLAEVRRAYQRGDWDRAADEAGRRLREHGDDAEALRLHARASIRRNRDEVGNAVWKDRLGPGRMQPEDYYLVGQSLARLGRDETALQVWEKGAGAGPEHPELLESLARQALALGRPDTADAAARRLSRLRGWEGRGWRLLGEARDLLYDPTAAAEALDHGLRSHVDGRGDPQSLAGARRLLARYWLRLGRPAEARGPGGIPGRRRARGSAGPLAPEPRLAPAGPHRGGHRCARAGRLLPPREPVDPRTGPLCGLGPLHRVPSRDRPGLSAHPPRSVEQLDGARLERACR